MSIVKATTISEDSGAMRVADALVAHTAATKELAQEADRLYRANELLREDLRKQRVELRESKQRQAVMEDALDEMRAELPPIQDFLTRIWQFSQDSGLQMPGGLSSEYRALKSGDPFDVQPAFQAPKRKRDKREVSRPGSFNANEGMNQKRAAPSGKGGASGRTAAKALFHAHDGSAYDMHDNAPLPYGEDDKDDNTDKNAHDVSRAAVQSSKEADVPVTLNIIVASNKCKATEATGNCAKKPKINHEL
ncbi:hypothetical protein SVAN01_07916 [Stagonosporopsis vannaccii]|nr:hypothetical protein SVAN01_07916 [Stagonosporopsis vannaccii]